MRLASFAVASGSAAAGVPSEWAAIKHDQHLTLDVWSLASSTNFNSSLPRYLPSSRRPRLARISLAISASNSFISSSSRAVTVHGNSCFTSTGPDQSRAKPTCCAPATHALSPQTPHCSMHVSRFRCHYYWRHYPPRTRKTPSERCQTPRFPNPVRLPQ